MKAVIVRSIQAIFKFRPFEKLLVGLIKMFPGLRFLKKLACQNKNYSTRAIRTCKRYGINYELCLNDYQCWVLYFYSDSDSSFGVLKHIKEGQVIIDVGGNIGQTAMMMALKTGSAGKIISFEPYKKTHDAFLKNLSLNKNIENVVAEKFALGEQATQLGMLEECTTNSGGTRLASITDTAHAHTQVVNVITLDSYIEEKKLNRVDFMKIDVEGFEMKVLLGGKKTLQKYFPELYIEIDDFNLKKQNNSAQEMLDFLGEMGYTIHDVATGNQILAYDQMTKGSRDIYCFNNKKGRNHNGLF